MLCRQKQKQHTDPMAIVNKYGWDAQSAVPGLKINPYEVFDSSQSGHGVMVGRLLDKEMDVVIKPHMNRDRALREMRVTDKISSLGLIAPEQVGVYDGREGYYLLSKRYPGLTTLTSLCLNTSVACQDNHKIIVPRLNRSGISLALFHNKNIVHLDFQAKNDAEGLDHERVWIDNEKAQIGSSIVNPVTRAQDLYKLMGSVMRKGFLSERSAHYRVRALHEAVVVPYTEAANQLNTDFDLLNVAMNAAANSKISIGKITDAAGMMIPRNHRSS